MARSRTARRSPRLGAYGFTAVLALLGVAAVDRESAPATATAPATRLHPPAPPDAPITDPVGATVTVLANAARAAAGLPALVEDPRLDRSATAQSVDQAARATMTHTGSDGSDPGQRMQAAGFAWHTWGENVAYGCPTADAVVAAWMNSPAHRANILSPTFTSIGIGSAPSAGGVLYWTMDLAA